MNEKRCCSTCFYVRVPYDMFPCRDCFGENLWVSNFNHTPEDHKRILNAVYGVNGLRDGIRDGLYRGSLEAKTTFFMPKIKKVIFNDPATIVFWSDDSKTVVKCQEGDTFDPEKGLAMAIAKKALGNKGNYCNELKKWLPKEEEAKKVELSYDGPSLAQMLKEAIGQSKLLECGPDISLS